MLASKVVESGGRGCGVPDLRERLRSWKRCWWGRRKSRFEGAEGRGCAT